jgi:putative tricarboxylic transport membrane protein
MLLILNLPLIGVGQNPEGTAWNSSVPSSWALILGSGMSNSSLISWSWWSGVIGYVLRKLDFPLAPVVLTLILGPMMERSLTVPGNLPGSFLVFEESQQPLSSLR